MVLNDTNLTNFKDLPIKIVPKITPKNKRLSYSPPEGMFNKICIWLLKDFDYVLFLDCDMILCENIDNIILEIIKYKRNNFITLVEKPKNAHDAFSTAWMLIKPDYEIFKNALKYLNISCTDQEMITFLYDNNEIDICYDFSPNIFDHIFHFNNWQPNKKYWETELGNTIYNILLENPNLMNFFEQIQLLVSPQPYESDRK